MARKLDIHEVPHSDGWALRNKGGERASSVHPIKNDALQQARDQRRRERIQVVIHKQDGRIQDSDSYGNESNPPRDKVR